MLTEIQVGWLGGVTIITKKSTIRLDPTTKSDSKIGTLISHAHGDHIEGFRKSSKSYLTI